MMRIGDKYPRRTAWRVSEKTPEITACEAMTVARVARISSGISAQSGASRKNGFLIASGFFSSNAPWPK